VPLKVKDAQPGVYAAAGGGYNQRARSLVMDLFKRHLTAIGLLMIAALSAPPSIRAGDLPVSGIELQIEATKKGLGKQVVISQGAKEWFMLIDVTPENAVVVRQEKDHDRYLVDESETHDRPMTPGEVDAAIDDYVNSVKTRVEKQ
jgi:hypothetical protein